MKRMMLCAISAIFCVLIGSCALDPNTYVEPMNTAKVATIHGQRHLGLSKISGHFLEKIDGKPVNNFWTQQMNLKITPGQHSLVVSIVDKNGFFKDMVGRDVTLNFKAQPGRDYYVKSKRFGDYVTAWIEDGRGSIVSAKVQRELIPGEEVNVQPLAR